MAVIPLTQGYSAIVDDCDYDRLSRWPWHAFKGSSGHIYAARNSKPDAEGRRGHIFMHRVLAGTPEGMDTDHINGNTLDNRRCNLRPATRAQNMWNRKANRGGSSSLKGVYWHKQHSKWCASIQVNKRRKHLGLFKTETEAASAYQKAAAAAFGRFYRERPEQPNPTQSK